MHTNKKVVKEMEIFLSSSYILYLKIHNFHWNVVGPMFNTLHTMFETQYTDLSVAVDDIAERMRALGAFAPGSFVEFSKFTLIKEASGRVKAQDMIKAIVQDHMTIAKIAKKVVQVAEELDDVGTADLATTRLEIHEKNAWMLRSLLE